MSLKAHARQTIGGSERPWVGVITDKGGRFVAKIHNKMARREFRPVGHTVMFSPEAFEKILWCAALELYDRDTGDTMRFDCAKDDWFHVVSLPVGDRVFIDLSRCDEYEAGPR